MDDERSSAIVGELEKALIQPSERSKYLRYHLNVPLTHEQDPIIDMAKWRTCSGGQELNEWPEYDFELLVRKWNLIEKPCWAGVDASWTTDLTAVVFIFPPFPQDQHGAGSEAWTLLPFFWLPDGQVTRLERLASNARQETRQEPARIQAPQTTQKSGSTKSRFDAGGRNEHEPLPESDRPAGLPLPAQYPSSVESPQARQSVAPSQDCSGTPSPQAQPRYFGPSNPSPKN